MRCFIFRYYTDIIVETSLHSVNAISTLHTMALHRKQNLIFYSLRNESEKFGRHLARYYQVLPLDDDSGQSPRLSACIRTLSRVSPFSELWVISAPCSDITTQKYNV